MSGDQKAKVPPKDASPEDRAKAEEHKHAGNTHLTAKRAESAIEEYTKAIELDPSNAIYYSNRAAAYTMKGDYEEAIEDCQMAININPSYAKGYSRLGAAFMGQEDYEQAMGAYEKAVQLDPDSVVYQSAIDQARSKMAQKERSEHKTSPMASGSPFPGPRTSPSAGGFDLGSLLNNPDIMRMASSMMNDPQLATMMQGMMGGRPPSDAGRPTSSPPAQEE